MGKTREQIIKEYAEKAFVPNDDAQGLSVFGDAFLKTITGGDYYGSWATKPGMESFLREENLRPVINEGSSPN